MGTIDQVHDLQIASPCKASWNAMAGDDRARFCSLCEKHVYNISALTSAEVSDLIRETQGEPCMRLYRRRDGTVLTADCPVGQKAFSSGRLHRSMTYAVLGIGFVLALCTFRAGAMGEWSLRRAGRVRPSPTGETGRCRSWASATTTN